MKSEICNEWNLAEKNVANWFKLAFCRVSFQQLFDVNLCINKSSKLNIYSFLISYFVERIKNQDRIDGSLVLKFFHLFSEHPLRGKFTFLSDGGVMVAMIRMCWGQVSGERSTQASEVCYKWLFVKLFQQEILIVTIQLVNDVKKIAKQNSFYTESW